MIHNLKDLHKLVNNKIENLNFGENPPELYDPIKYFMSLGGKRVRPLLTLMSYLLYKDNPSDIINQAVSVEVFHNFTLVHDDIMDNAPLRRGNETVHQKWNSNIAILSGDVMLVKVYDILLEGLSPEMTAGAISLFNKAAIKVCEGQQLDMNFENRETVSTEEYIEMIRLKTAELLAFSLEFGAFLAEKTTEMSHFYEFGINIGLGFQIKDDLLDVYGDGNFGKQAGGDIISRKKTFLTIKTLELASEKDRKQLLKWFGCEPGISDEERVKKVTAMYDKYHIKSITEDLMNDYFNKGFLNLRQIDAPLNRKTTLRSFAESLIERIR